MKALDIVKTPDGGIGIITETNDNGTMAAITYFGEAPVNAKSAWWRKGDGLEIIDNLPRVLASRTAHPFGSGSREANEVFPKENYIY